MNTATIEIKNDIAIGLLQYLESVDIIKVLEERDSTEKKTLGDFFGILPDETCKELEEHTKKARSEWDRGF